MIYFLVYIAIGFAFIRIVCWREKKKMDLSDAIQSVFWPVLIGLWMWYMWGERAWKGKS